MRFVTILIVLGVLGWLGQQQLSAGHETSAPEAQRVVDGARTQLDAVDTSGQARIDRAIEAAEAQR
jgi:hypothetical protein